jgi:hypothetical protein
MLPLMGDVALLVLAALLGYGFARLQERQRLRREALGVARILRRDVFWYVIALGTALHQEQWPPSMPEGMGRLTLDNWRRLDTELAGSMRDTDAFENVQDTFEAMAKMLEPQTDFDERWMRKVHDGVAWRALEALEDLSLSKRTRIMRKVNAFRWKIGLPSRAQRAMDEAVGGAGQSAGGEARENAAPSVGERQRSSFPP